MVRFQVTDIEADIFAELLIELHELYEACEQTLIALEHAPTDTELQHALFRAVHTIKGNLGLLNLNPLIQMVDLVESCISLLRENKLHFSVTLSDFLLLNLEKVNHALYACQQKGEFFYNQQKIERIDQLLNSIASDNQAQHQAIIRSALLTLEPQLGQNDHAHDSDPTYAGFTISRPEDDLAFFRKLMQPVEARSQYWHGRCERQLKLALLINRYAGSVVDELQLTAACYVHDFGMGFMPLELLHKKTPLTETERHLIQTHVYCSAKLLENMPYWQPAKMMVLQHHERADGSGYPLGLQDNDITAGAKILALVDTFEAMTHERSSASHLRRPYQRALGEINRLAGTQLSPYWVAAFNQAMQALLAQNANNVFN